MNRLAPRPRSVLAAALCALALLALAAPLAPAAGKSGIRLPTKKLVALVELQHPRGLNRFVRKVSDPRSPRYRHYATVEKLIARYGAKPQTTNPVQRWLGRHGLHGKPAGAGAYLLVPLPASRAARLLPRAASARPGSAAARVGRRIPPGLRGAVTGISLLSPKPLGAGAAAAEPVASAAAGPVASASAQRQAFRSVAEHSGTASGCAAGSSGALEPGFEPFTPNQYLTAYGLRAMHAKGLEGQGQTIAVVEGGGFKYSDIVTFTRCFGSKPPPIKVVHVSGPAMPEDEPTLDVSVLSIAAPKAKKIYAYEGGEAPENLIETAGLALGSRGHHPDVISMSYGYCETELSNNPGIREALDNVFAVAAGAGISTLISAGDNGSSDCRTFTPEGEQITLPVLAVSQPASSAYTTSVGGTNLALSKKNRINSEVVWNDWPLQASGGGGGSSLLYPRTPWWQRSVHRYGIGRKVPDISALADIYPGYAFFCTAAECKPEEAAVFGWRSIGGTSAAAPLMAAAVALANQYAARHRQPSLGFLNPLLYQLGASKKTRNRAFNDVVLGNNDVARGIPAEIGGHPVGCCVARTGYDRASGWGSLKVPGFAKLAAAAAR